MHHWRIAAFAASALGTAAGLLVLVAEWGGIRFGGFAVFYSSAVQEVEGISLLFLLGVVLYMVDRVTAIEAALPSLRDAHAESKEVVHPGESERDAEVPVAFPESPDTASGNPESGPLIRIDGLGKVYDLGPVKVHALRSASMDIPAASITVILGPSGSGKTTLLNLLGGIDRASSGRILFDGTDVTKLDDREIVDYRRERVGFVFQFFNLIPSLTARENVALAAELVPHAADVEKVFRMVGLGDRMDHFPPELSGGEQQRVAIARALVKNPPLLLCDEPTGELDYATGVKILEILRAVAHGDGRAVIVVTHNAAIAEMADQVVRLQGGRIDRITRNPEPVPPTTLRW